MLRMDARVCAVFFFQLICFVRFVLFSGVEHLLRDVKDTTISTLATEVIFHDWIFFPHSHAALFKAHPKLSLVNVGH